MKVRVPLSSVIIFVLWSSCCQVVLLVQADDCDEAYQQYMMIMEQKQQEQKQQQEQRRIKSRRHLRSHVENVQARHKMEHYFASPNNNNHNNNEQENDPSERIEHEFQQSRSPLLRQNAHQVAEAVAPPHNNREKHGENNDNNDNNDNNMSEHVASLPEEPNQKDDQNKAVELPNQEPAEQVGDKNLSTAPMIVTTTTSTTDDDHHYHTHQISMTVDMRTTPSLTIGEKAFLVSEEKLHRADGNPTDEEKQQHRST